MDTATLSLCFTVLLAIIGGVVWAIRLEGKFNVLAKDVENLWRQRDNDIDAAEKSRAELLSAVAEIRTDIKELLKQSKR